MLKKSNKMSLEEATRLAILGKLSLNESTTVSTTGDGLTTVETDDANIVIEPKDNAAVDIGMPVETCPECVEEPVADLPVEEIVEPIEEVPTEEVPVEEIIDEEPLDESKKIEEGEAPLFDKQINEVDIKKVEHKLTVKENRIRKKKVETIEAVETTYIDTFDELRNFCWGSAAESTLNEVERLGKEDDLMGWLESVIYEPIDSTSLNDIVAYDETLPEDLGLFDYAEEDDDLEECKEIKKEELSDEQVDHAIELEDPEFFLNAAKKIVDNEDKLDAIIEEQGKDYYGAFKKLIPALKEFINEVYENDESLTENKKLEEGEAPLFKKVISKHDIKKVESKEKVEEGEAPLFDEKINEVDIKKVESKEVVEEAKLEEKEEPKKHIINKVDLRKEESKDVSKDLENHLRTKVAEGLTKFVKEAYTNGKEVKVEKVLKLTENKLYVKGSLVMENSTRDFTCKLIPVMENKTFRKYTINENKLLKITEGKTSKGKTFNLIIRK